MTLSNLPILKRHTFVESKLFHIRIVLLTVFYDLLMMCSLDNGIE